MDKPLPPMSKTDRALAIQCLAEIRGREGRLLITGDCQSDTNTTGVSPAIRAEVRAMLPQIKEALAQTRNTDDSDFVGYVSWIEEVGLFFVTLAAVGAMVWIVWVIGKSAGAWS